LRLSETFSGAFIFNSIGLLFSKMAFLVIQFDEQNNQTTPHN